uniref:translation initiation factor IF-2-like n=1 Tax=Callithrix jacchus TaxID=9483 RepID=UPI0023DD35DD|nr:translation initiation factor IF-2-like [Callithrix jacchus]
MAAASPLLCAAETALMSRASAAIVLARLDLSFQKPESVVACQLVQSAAPGKGCAGQETGRPQPVPELPCRLVAAERPPARLARAPGPPPSSSPACARERAESSSAQDRGREVLFAATSAPALGPLLSRVQAALRRDPLHAVPRRGSLGHSPLPSIRRAAGPEPRFPEQGNGRAVPTGEGRSRRPAFGAWRIRAASAVQENPSPLAIPGILFPSRSPKPGLELEPQLPAHRCSVPGPLPLDPEPPGPSAPLQPSPELSCPPRPLQPPPPAGRLPGPSRPAGQPRGGATRAHPLPPRAAARPGLSGRLAGRRGGPGAGGEAASARPVGASAEAGASPGRPGAGAGRAGGGGRAGPALGFLGPCTHARFPGASPSASPLPLICKITPRWVTLLLPLFRCESPDTTEISIQAPDATRPHAEESRPRPVTPSALGQPQPAGPRGGQAPPREVGHTLTSFLLLEPALSLCLHLNRGTLCAWDPGRCDLPSPHNHQTQPKADPAQLLPQGSVPQFPHLRKGR